MKKMHAHLLCGKCPGHSCCLVHCAFENLRPDRVGQEEFQGAGSGDTAFQGGSAGGLFPAGDLGKGVQVQHGFAGMGIGLALGQLQKFTKKPTPGKTGNTEAPSNVEGKCRVIGNLHEALTAGLGSGP